MESNKKYRDYWLEQIQRNLPVLDLPTDKIRSAVKSYHAKSVSKIIDKKVVSNFKTLLKAEGYDFQTGFISVLNLLLYKYTNQTDLLTGNVVFSNIIPLKVTFSAQSSSLELLKIVNKVIQEGIAHQPYPFESLLKDLNLEPDQHLINVAIASAGDVNVAVYQFDLCFIYKEVNDELSIDIVYNEDLFHQHNVTYVSDHLEQLMIALTDNPAQPVNQLTYLSDQEKSQVLKEFNHTAAAYPLALSVLDMFEEQVNTKPDNLAVVFGTTSITYRELDQRSNQFSNYLIRQRKIHSGDLAAIKLERSEWMMISILAILKAGAAYVPIDSVYPQDRIDYMITNSGSKLVITAEEIDLFITEQDNFSTTSPRITINPESLIYVIYTSGSTGLPKGCALMHSNVSNYIQWANRYYFGGISPANFGLFTSLSFDLTVTSIFCPLTQGGTLVIYPQHEELSAIFSDTFSSNSLINSIKITPAHISMLKHMDISSSGIKCAIVGGEEVSSSHVEILKTINPEIKVYNEYGPTEATVGCIVKELHQGTPIYIGKPISNTSIYILNTENQLVPQGIFGEICVSGAGLAKGYLNNPVLTAEKFITNPFESDQRLYKTGDLGRWLPNGEIEFIGRKDEQVKIRGFRIELGEIETVLQNYKGISLAVVLARTDAQGEKKLVAYLVPLSTDKNIAPIRKYLNEKLPEYMVPSSFVWMNDLPKTTNGKIDKKALPAPDRKRPELSVLYRSPKTAEEKKIASLWASILDLDQVGLEDNFFELGGNSLLAVKTTAALQAKYQINLPVTKLYQYPTISQLLTYLGLTAEKPVKKRVAGKADPAQPIAIIGMAAKFPGASTIDELWEILRDGKETTTFFNKEELDPSISQEVKNDDQYVAARGIIKDAEMFDAEFFGINPKLAELMDPQQRVFLEISRDVLEKTGHLADHYDGTIGVFAGSGANTYFQNNVLQHPDRIHIVGSFQVSTVNEKDYISSRTAYQLNLKGPAVSVFSACSTSLLAIAQAVESLRKNQCDVAIAGGASITSPIHSGHLYQEGAMLSKDGHCRSFDAAATGTVFSDGAGVVLLKTLAAAEADGDLIYGLIKGIGVNNDGGNKGSFTAPSTDGQSIAIAMAIEDAAIDPATITYVEAHGTATPLGDPIEIEGLRLAFGEQTANQYCAIGSIKSNMGHMTSAAGVAGVIKTALSLYHKQIPPTINFDQPNPDIDFQRSPFYVNATLQDWYADGKRRAGVSSFGVGGTNVHVVMEEHDHAPLQNIDTGKSKQLFTWSARKTESLQGYTSALQQYVSATTNLADVASTLHSTRANFSYRRFAIAGTAEELNSSLEQPLSAANSNQLKTLPSETVFLFPGQGAQYPGMGAGLYKEEAVFKLAVDECAEILRQYMDKDIRSIIYPEITDESARQDIANTKYTQPALFVTEYALAKLWMSWGIMPDILCGHSIGEYVAAHLAGVFSLEDGLKLIATRGNLVSALPKGSMLSIRHNADKIVEILPADLSLAAVNSHNLCVVAGTDEAVDQFSATLDAQEILHKKLFTSHAFHSHMMDAIVPGFKQLVDKIDLKRPQKPIVSTVTGEFLKDAEATDPAYWAEHLRNTVQFSKALDTIMELENPAIIESGPGNVCTTLVFQHPKKNIATAVASLDQKEGVYDSILKALGKIWLAGLDPDWSAFYHGQDRRRIELPAYTYHKKRFWVEPKSNQNSIDIKQSFFTEQNVMRKDTLIEQIKTILENASGIEMNDVTPDLSFVEIGMDSLLLTQMAIILKKEFAIPVTFRQLNEEFDTIESLAAYIDQTLPKEEIRQAAAPLNHTPANQSPVSANNYINTVPQQSANMVPADSALGLIAQQLQLLSRQVELMTGVNPPAPLPSTTPLHALANGINPNPVLQVKKEDASLTLSAEEQIEIKKPFGATARIERKATVLSDSQQQYLAEFIKLYNQKTAKSKAYTAQHRGHMADPRVVSGFKPATKELVYSIVINKSKGSHFWDLDGNDYVDALNGFGSSMLGYQPDVIKAALIDQIEKGYEIGPQHELSGEVCELICEFTDFDRAALCNTGSEAVLGAMRIARTVTGRSLIVAFTGSYHGIVDEVIVRGTKKLKSFPAAPGIMPEAVENMLILDYGTDETLRIIRERANELAAVLVEPIQSRRPELQPIAFLKELRTITKQSGSALIFDEVISGFRFHPRGIQGMFGIKADLGTYGKVAGGGISVGIIAGERKFMDALDGGNWQFGDDSIPEIGVTYFAGTFVRHPLTLATTKAALLYMKAEGPQLQVNLNEKTTLLANALTEICVRLKVPMTIVHFGSLWRIKFLEEYLYSELLFTLMRYKNVHILDGFPCFMTTAHTQEDINKIISTFEESVTALKAAQFIPLYETEQNSAQAKVNQNDFNTPPVPHAKIGKDQAGNPAWFIEDVQNPGKYLQVN